MHGRRDEAALRLSQPQIDRHLETLDQEDGEQKQHGGRHRHHGDDVIKRQIDLAVLGIDKNGGDDAAIARRA